MTGDAYMLFDVPDIIGDSIREQGNYQRQFADYVVDYIRTRAPTADVLDIGANVGTFTIPVAKGITGTVHSFEIQRTVFMQLCGNCVLNSLDNVIPYHACVTSDTIAPHIIIPKVDFSNPLNIGGFSTIDTIRKMKDNVNDATRVDYNNTENVATLSLDSLNLNNIGFIKIDVEGAELDVLKSMTQTIVRNNHPPILFECWCFPEYKETANKIFAFVNSLGYIIHPITGHPCDYIATLD